MATAVRGRKRRMPSTATRSARNAFKRWWASLPPEKRVPQDWQQDLLTPLIRLQAHLPTTGYDEMIGLFGPRNEDY